MVVGVGGRVERSMLHSSLSVVVTSLLSSESGNTGLSVSVTVKELLQCTYMYVVSNPTSARLSDDNGQIIHKYKTQDTEHTAHL